ncbi:MAG: NAD(P)/FAD-dependent oxidoreductase [Atopobiaceae bacterium]|nr:NAD(P)/FAD-dependent oxidoreductase [Atopobiaceae bacterium]
MGEERYDVVIIGAGVSGCAVARELARYDARVCVVERADDVCCGTSKANSAIVHAGFDAQPGTLMAKLNVEGNRLLHEMASELNFALVPCGSLVVCNDEEARPALEALRERGVTNGVEGLRIVEREELREMEPNVVDEAVCALWAPTGAIVDPFGLNVALAENAATNGVDFVFNAEVTGLARDDEGWTILTTAGEMHSRVVVNAAGVYADELHNMVANDRMRIVARKGEYLLLDTTAFGHVRHTVFMLPTKMGKGVLVSPTVHGNVIVGPTATDVENKEGVDTTSAGLAEVASKCALTVRDVPLGEVITSFAGLRAHDERHDFFIGEVPGAPGFVDCAAIESPGLTSCPAIGRMVAGIVRDMLGLAEKPAGAFTSTRPGVVNLVMTSLEDWNKLVAEDPAYGHVVCRCCRVSEAQIVDVLHRPVPARSIDAIKRRTGCTMGRCQGGFCTPKIMAIMERELGMAPEEVTKSGPGSELLVSKDGE